MSGLVLEIQRKLFQGLQWWLGQLYMLNNDTNNQDGGNLVIGDFCATMFQLKSHLIHSFKYCNQI